MGSASMVVIAGDTNPASTVSSSAHCGMVRSLANSATPAPQATPVPTISSRRRWMTASGAAGRRAINR